MELTLFRSYYPKGTNGIISDGEQLVCSTIELPWKDNQRRISCIPEGKYELGKRYTEERGWHLKIKNVIGRSFILFHPANDALKELKGCISPVMELTGPGKGSFSRKANYKVKKLVFHKMDKGEKVYIFIKKLNSYESNRKSERLVVLPI